ncbi:hypothetical protein Dsin_007188 [Dipteronia sinensis]|uniref:Uncharacterized protein n=1 Tax=Dipteronia sinensis TaxID=43782 RepID=A0AAE0B019_9ROSI|nr:hypothetical protein Dsin_007188 [Dipteronia sinensis]
MLVPQEWHCPDQIYVVIGEKCFVIKISEELSSIDSCWLEKILGTIPAGGRNGKDLSPAKEVRRIDGGANPIPFTLTFENGAEKAEHGKAVFRKRDASSISVNSFEVDLGQEEKLRDECPSEVKSRDVVVIDGLCSEISSDVIGSAQVGVKAVLGCSPSLFQADRTELIFGSEGVSENIRGRKRSASMKRHNMILRNSKACEKMKQQNPERINIVAWNLEDKVAKVLEKGMALGFNFYGKKKELLEIIASREEVNNNRFRDLVRRLVLKHKSTE